MHGEISNTMNKKTEECLSKLQLAEHQEIINQNEEISDKVKALILAIKLR